MQLFRAIVFYLGYWTATLIFGFLSLLSGVLPKSFGQKMILWWIDFVLLWLRLCCGISVKLSGHLEVLKKPCVIVANHQSNWETFYFQQHFSPLSTILKQELLRIPFFGWGLSVLDPIAIDRGNPIQALKKIKSDGVKRLNEGKHVLVFPEGTRKPVGQLGDYKRSAADIALQAGVQLVPIAHNSGEFWLNKKVIKNPGSVSIFIGEPIETAGKNTKVLMQEVRAWTQVQLDKIYQESRR